MKAGYLGVTVILIGVLMLGLTTVTWWEASVEDPAAGELELPERTVELTGVEISAASVPGALLVMASGVALVLVGPAGRLGGRRGRTVAIGGATVVVVSATVAILLTPVEIDVQVVTLGGAGPQPAIGPAYGIYLVALIGAAILCGLAWRLRQPPATPAAPEASSYTVEAVQASTSEDDEWDLADAALSDEPMPQALPPAPPTAPSAEDHDR